MWSGGLLGCARGSQPGRAAVGRDVGVLLAHDWVVRSDLPSGTVSFLFTDVEGSTKLLHELGPAGYAEALGDHRRVLREAVSAHGGVEVDTQGDAFFVAFRRAPDALEAAAEAVEGLSGGRIRVRMGIHTGTPIVADEGYVGVDVHRAARIAACGQGGQVLVSAATAALVGAQGLRDLGEHRLKDLSAPERIYQLGRETFAPLKSLNRTNLPVPATPFLGRRRELDEVVSLARRADVRLLTLTGPGGTGKTRLALQAAAELSDEFPDGVWWIPLAAIRDPSLVLPAVAKAVGVTEEWGGELAATLAAHLDGKRMLVVLDNAEHLLPVLADELSAVAAACPSLDLLLTSRERLQIAVETVWPVPPLLHRDAQQMFVERARSLGVELRQDENVSELCRRLDELPLALELAAARTVVFSPQQLLERLTQRLDLLKGGRDADPRQRTLRTTIDWSHELLAVDEQRVFCTLSVFTGGCTYEAAEEIADADPDILQSLLDKSLLTRRDTEQGPRYWMLETIRDYAIERLESRGDAAEARRRHAEWYRDLARGMLGVPGPGVQRMADEPELERFRDPYDNVRSALLWSWATGSNDLGIELGASCGRYWLGEGLFRDATSWLRETVPQLPAAPPEIRLQAGKVAGLVAFYVLANSGQADALWAEARIAAEELQRDDETAWLDHRLSSVAWERGDVASAIASLERLLAYHRASGNHFEEANVLHNLGEALRDTGHFDEAERRLLHAEALYRERDTPRALANNTHSLGDLALDRGDYQTAIALYRKCIENDTGERQRSLAYSLAGIASALAELNRERDAALTWGAVCAAEESIGFRMVALERRRYEAHLKRLQAHPAWSSGRSLSLDEALASLVHLD
jgi:predicted ATPase/class 3 adenylate cyclase